MKLSSEALPASSANAGVDGARAIKPRAGGPPSSALDFFSHLRERTSTGAPTTSGSGQSLRTEAAGEPSSGAAVAVHVGAHRPADGRRAAMGDARAPSEPTSVASIDWPWLAIATGGLSYRPTSSAVFSTDAFQIGTSAALHVAPTKADAAAATPAQGRITGASDQLAFPASFFRVSAMDSGSLADTTPEVHDLNAAALPLPAELRELLERRRVRLIEDGRGGLHLFARDFTMDDVQAAHWAASLKSAYQSMHQPLRALWINGRPYEVQHGELHDR